MMRPMPASMYPHRVLLRAKGSLGLPGEDPHEVYAGEGDGGTTVEVAADVQDGAQVQGIAGERPVAIRSCTVYLTESPDLPPPGDGPPRKATTGDRLDWLDTGGIYLLLGPPRAAVTGAGGGVLCWRVEVEGRE